MIALAEHPKQFFSEQFQPVKVLVGPSRGPCEMFGGPSVARMLRCLLKSKPAFVAQDPVWFSFSVHSEAEGCAFLPFAAGFASEVSHTTAVMLFHFLQCFLLVRILHPASAFNVICP